MLTIVMYHYVRDLKRSRFPRIKGLEIELFRQQLQYLRRHYAPVTMEQVIAATQCAQSLPANPVLLTFDDGYADHFQFVLPVLEEMGIQGSFFPPARACLENRVLDVNKVHYVLASVDDAEMLAASILVMLEEFRGTYPIESNDAYLERYAKPSRFDPPEVIFIKRMLQVGLPEPVRNAITEELFHRHVTDDEAAFAAELYMSIDQLRWLVRRGMYVGSHGYDHYWLDSLDRANQERQIDLSLDFLRRLGCDTRNWTMCYPFGAWNESLLSILRQRGCRLGLTTRVDLADMRSDPLTLPRLDTNDLSKSAVAPPNAWTVAARSSDPGGTSPVARVA